MSLDLMAATSAKGGSSFLCSVDASEPVPSCCPVLSSGNMREGKVKASEKYNINRAEERPLRGTNQGCS